MKGSIANGSRRTTPTAPVAAAVVSEDSVAPMKTPWFQSRASVTSGIVVLRRPPKRIAEIGTPGDLRALVPLLGSYERLRRRRVSVDGRDGARDRDAPRHAARRRRRPAAVHHRP